MGESKVYGYARVSSKEQNLDRQIQALEAYGIDSRDIVKEKASGKNFDRPLYKNLKENMLRQGDTLVVKELDRLGRNMEAIKLEWQQLVDMGINIIVIDTPILNTKNKGDLEKTLISNVVFELLSYLSEKERLKIRQRQQEGINMLKEKNGGHGVGRPKISYPENFEEVYKTWKSGEITAKLAMQKLDLKKSTFYKLVQDWENNKKD